jgi:hypothetical protein
MKYLAIAVILAIAITHVNAYYGVNGTKVEFQYSLSPFEKLTIFLFGAEDLKDRILSLVNSTSYEILNIGYDSATLLFPVSYINGTYFFEGVELNEEMNITLYYPGNVTLEIYSSKIPASAITSLELEV